MSDFVLLLHEEDAYGYHVVLSGVALLHEWSFIAMDDTGKNDEKIIRHTVSLGIAMFTNFFSTSSYYYNFFFFSSMSIGKKLYQ